MSLKKAVTIWPWVTCLYGVVENKQLDAREQKHTPFNAGATHSPTVQSRSGVSLALLWQGARV